MKFLYDKDCDVSKYYLLVMMIILLIIIFKSREFVRGLYNLKSSLLTKIILANLVIVLVCNMALIQCWKSQSSKITNGLLIALVAITPVFWMKITKRIIINDLTKGNM